jgi:hypothetical protein
MNEQGAARSVVSDVETNDDGNEEQLIAGDDDDPVEMSHVLPESGSSGHHQQGYSDTRQDMGHPLEASGPQGDDENENHMAAYPMGVPQYHPQFHLPVQQPPPPPGLHMLQIYEAQMRDHAAAYASAAAGAAWAAAQIAADMAHASTVTSHHHPGGVQVQQNPHIPRSLPAPPPQIFPTGQVVPYGPTGGPPVYPPSPQFMDHTMGGMPHAAGYSNNMESSSQDYTYNFGPMRDGMNYPANNNTDDGSFASDSYGHRRRKRQQRMPPSDSGMHRPPSYEQQQQQKQQQHSGGEKRGRRRRFRPDGSSENGSFSNSNNDKNSHPHAHQGNVSNNNSKRKARIGKVVASSNSSDGGSSGAPTYFNKKKKARQPSDDSLLGKTGVSALYEWCGKRRTTPTFTLQHSDAVEPAATSQNGDGESPSTPVVDEEKRHRVDEFDIAVSIDGMEWGRGRGRTKAAAKQEAARRALQALLPGIAFDEASGILVRLPSTPTTGGSTSCGQDLAAVGPQHAATWKASESLEDLAPNLAKRLAIGHTEDDELQRHPTKKDIPIPVSDRKEHSKKRPSKWHGVYPCTSTTTSDEEDENAYYASRGASVCSALLHAMVQIDDRIPEAPNYTYEISAVSAGSGNEDEGEESETILKRKAETGDSLPDSRTPIRVHRGPFSCKASMRLKRTPKENVKHPAKAYDLLQAVGVGGSKREARHTASAKLLVLLFPDCDGMVQVKEAAEAAREQYAASKALKQQSKRERAFMSKTHSWNQSSDHSTSIAFAFNSPSKSPKLPTSVEEHLLRGLGASSDSDQVSLDEESAKARQLSRQKQLDDRITAALQKLNEHDDEGRSLPDEPTVDDVVGRTVLRRAGTEDLHWIAKLLDEVKSPISPISVLGPLSPNKYQEEDSNELASASMRMWSSSTIVLLLCRAIAPYDDPPLGCAVLFLGFSLEKGKLLRVAQIGSKPHLPRERFIECLQAFANSMQCSLETNNSATSQEKPNANVTMGRNDIKGILKSHFTASESIDQITVPWFLATSTKIYRQRSREESFVAAPSPLQSVQEESEGVEESGAESGPEKRVAKKDQDKPSKRSRVQ